MTAIVCGLLMLMLLAFSDAAMAAALSAAQCFARGVMPALLPMMILGKMLPNPTTPDHSRFSAKIRPVLFGFAAGSPAAAQKLRSGGWQGRGWECMLCLTGVISPMFFTGTLAAWLGSAKAGWMLLFSHWAGAGVSAALWRRFAKSKPVSLPAQSMQKVTLPEAIAQSAHSLLCILGAMMVFSVAAGLLRSLLVLLFPKWTVSHPYLLAFVHALLEIGSGAKAVIDTAAHPIALLAGLCGFGGLSIWLQNLLFVGNDVRPGRLLMMRALHGAVSYAIVRLWSLF